MAGDGIDTRFVLALHALGTESFGNGRVAALPRPAVGFALEALRFFPPRVAEDGEKAHRFALHVNSRIVPPTGTPSGTFLWDEYEEVLDPRAVRLAERLPTAEEQARYEQARAFLGPEVMSAYAAGVQAVGTAKLALGTVRANRPAPGSPEEAAWEAAVEAASDAVKVAETDLLIHCRADQVRAAVTVVENWSAAATAVSWSDRSDDFELAKLSGLDGGEYLLTTFSPSDVVDGRGWAAFELLPDRIDGLVSGLGGLAAGVSAPDARVRRMTVELTHVMVDRPWYEPGVFRSNAWRFADPARPPVSDGKDAPAGSFPYLVTGLVLARSLTLEVEKPAAGAAPPPPLRLDYLEQFTVLDESGLIPERLIPVPQPDPVDPVDPRVVEPVPDFVDRSRFKVIDRAAVLEAVTQPVAERTFRVGEVGLDRSAVLENAATLDRAVTLDRSAALDRSAVLEAVAFERPQVFGFAGRRADAGRAVVAHDRLIEAVQVGRGHKFDRAGLSPVLTAAILDRDFVSADPITPPPPPPAASVETTTLVGADEVIVVAYLLEPVGAAPDPDQTLHWT